MFANAGPIAGGMTGMMNMLLYVMLLFHVLQFLSVTDAFDNHKNALVKRVHSERFAEVADIIIILGDASINYYKLSQNMKISK